MKRVRQTFKEIADSLMPVEATWLDTHAEEVITVLKSLPDGLKPTSKDVRKILDDDFQVGFTVVRLFLDVDLLVPADLVRKKRTSPYLVQRILPF